MSTTFDTTSKQAQSHPADQIEQSLRLLVDPEHVVELRAPKCTATNYRKPHTRSGFYDVDHLDAMARRALAIERLSPGTYFTLNPVHRDLLSRRHNREDIANDGAEDVNIVRRRWLLVDADPVRIANVSSTDTEKALARDQIKAVRDYLQEQGWPDPIVADSGNGFHLLYRIELPTDDGELVKRCLKALAHQFDTEAVKIDTSVFNPSRIVKLYGTLSRKGDSTNERPHRRSAILRIPDELQTVDIELIGSLARQAPEPTKSMTVKAAARRHPSHRHNVADRAAKYLATMPVAVSGQKGHDATFRAACTLVLGFDLRPDDAFPILSEWNARCEPPWTEGELRHKLDDADKKTDPRGYLLNGKSSQNGHSQPSANSQPAEDHEPVVETQRPKPVLILPGDTVSISQAGEQLGELLARSGQVFRRGAAVVQLAEDDDGEPILRPVKPANLASLAESVAVLVKVRHTENGAVQSPAVMQEQTSKLILHADAFVNELPPIRILSRCPVLVEVEGELVQVTGYHRPSGVLASGGDLPDVSLDQAVRLLTDILVDFKFASEGDRARAIAATITPALLHGGLLGGRGPVDLSEADQSQTGKGFWNKLKAAIYRQLVSAITQRKSGVGGLDESFDAALIRGALFPCLDNVRGKIDSPAIESFLTEDRYSARVPYSSAVEIDPRRTTLMFTSNKAEFVSRDLPNRSSCVRFLKQEQSHEFAKFHEGDVLDHVRANQPLYLAAVFRVVRHWHEQGKPRTGETRHDFRRWSQSLDWIVVNVFGCVPLLEGHDSARERMTNPTLSWLRDLALLVVQSGRHGEYLRAYELLDLLRDTEVEIPGVTAETDLDEEASRLVVLRAVGTKLGRCFAGRTEVEIDGMTVERQQGQDMDGRQKNQYRFSPATVSPNKPPTTPHQIPQQKPAVPPSPPMVFQLLNAGVEESPPKQLSALGGTGACWGKQDSEAGKTDPETAPVETAEGDAWTF